MVAGAECICHPTVAFQYLCVATPPKIEAEFFDVPQPDAATTVSVEISRRESVRFHVTSCFLVSSDIGWDMISISDCSFLFCISEFISYLSCVYLRDSFCFCFDDTRIWVF